MPFSQTPDSKFLFPAIDLRGGQVVRLYKGDYAQQTTYGSDPVAQAKVFEAAGATWLHVVDLDGARSGQVEHLEVIRAICRETKLKVEVGGGVRSTAAVDQLLAAGVEVIPALFLHRRGFAGDKAVINQGRAADQAGVRRDEFMVAQYQVVAHFDAGQ